MSAKEIWYVWDGKTVVSGVHKAMLNTGHVHGIRGGSALGSLQTDREYFTHYTLGETRERVECEVCEGFGRYDLMVCHNCKGRGYIWKMGVKV